MTANSPSSASGRFRWTYRIVGALSLLFGLYFLVTGGYLAMLGGSRYFAAAGIAMSIAGVLLYRGRPSGAWLYALTLAASAAWAIVDAGWNFWPLFSRLSALGVPGLLVALVHPALPAVRGRGAFAVAAVLAVALAAAVGGMFTPRPTVAAAGNGPGLTPVEPARAQKDWPHYGNTNGGSRFAALDQINRGNVGQLQVAWTYRTGDVAISDGNGAEKWVYQTVHNDLWDFDLPMQPSFIDFARADGSTVPALVIGTKAGQLYVLDRATGTPLTEVKEIPVRKADIVGEPYAETQPLSVGMPQIGGQRLTESDIWGATPFDQLLCRIAFRKMRYEGLYTAPGTDVSLSFPGSLGGMNWGGISTDPVHGFIFVNDMRLGLWVRMIPSSNGGARQSPDRGDYVIACALPAKS